MDNPNDPFLVHLGKYERHRKIFVEPIPVLFHQLKQNLGNMTNATFINAAISSMAEGTLTFMPFTFLRLATPIKGVYCTAPPAGGGGVNTEHHALGQAGRACP